MSHFRIYFLVCAAWGGILTYLQGQNCPNPIVIESVTVLNATCGNNSGGIIVNVAGGNGGLNFAWSPVTPGSNSIFNVPADAYTLTIKRNGNNQCRLDTTIIVNNSDGPAVQIVSISPASCSAKNGRVILAPANLNYFWSDNGTGSVKEQLAAGCYTVTATAPNGCYSVFSVCVPVVNNLQVTSQLLKPAKCNKPTGTVGLTISGGSGNYSYSLGNGSPTISGLTANTYTCLVTDNVSGCRSTTTFTVPAATVTADVDLSTYDVRCPRNNDGYVVFTVKPEMNFDLPYTFTLKNASTGANASPGALAPGLYDLTIIDADGCPLAPASFYISAPDPFLLQADQKPQDCNGPGQLLLNMTGGNGKYIVDWADIPGTNNARDRLNLPAGIYKATIYDSLFCEYVLPPTLVPNLCTRSDTLYRFVRSGQSDTICLSFPTGVEKGSYRLIGKSVSGSSPFGSWRLQPGGCLIYDAKGQTGFARDTICVLVSPDMNGLDQSYCIVVSIDALNPRADTLYFTVQRNSTAVSCASLPPDFTNYKVVRTNGKGLAGTSGSFGSYTVHPATGCVSFKALNQAGYFVDTICVSYYDQILKRSFTVCHVPSVLPITDCQRVPLPDSLLVELSDCTKRAEVCIPIPFTDLPGYAIANNSLPYTGGFSGCDLVERTAYALPNLLQGSPFTLNVWNVDGQPLGSGVFANAIGLLALVNRLDPDGNWQLRDNNTVLAGGNSGKTYGNMRIVSSSGVSSNLSPSGISIPNGTLMKFDYGLQRVTFRQFNTGCIDTIAIRVKCTNCAPVHSYTAGTDGFIRWKTTRCNKDTLFCTNIPYAQIQNYIVTDNGKAFKNFFPCGATTGFLLDTGRHHLTISSPTGACKYDLRFALDCVRVGQNEVTNVVIQENQRTQFCIDTNRLSGKVFNMTRTCVEKSKNLLDWSFDAQKKCVWLTGLDIGSDTFCVQICTLSGDCVSTQFNIRITDEQDSLKANPDFAFTRRGQAVRVPVLENDNTTEQVTVNLLSFPRRGQVVLNAADGSFLYTPAPADSCYTEQFSYRICTKTGACDSSEVTIKVYCDKILIFNGISPNGDGDNDVWHLPGIELFPNNEVRILNRWGNVVFQAKPYSDTVSWDGIWDGKNLPDGVYYYIIDLGDKSEKLSGWIQLLR